MSMHGPGDCPFCGGWGKTWHYTWDARSAFTQFCWTCQGTGFLPKRKETP